MHLPIPSVSLSQSVYELFERPSYDRTVSLTQWGFYPRGASSARVMAIIVCLSVCLCVCHIPVLYQNG